MPDNHTNKPIYDNLALYTPNGKLVGYTNQRRVDWYMKRGLVIKMGDKDYRFTFTPNGMDEVDEFDTTPRDNICVQCGTDEMLSKHHTVPYEFRKLFPLEYKDANSQDIVPICRADHDAYEILALDERRNLYATYCQDEEKYNNELQEAKRCLRLLKHFELMKPEDWNRKNQIVKDFIMKYHMSRAEILEAEKYNLAQVVINKMGIENVITHWKHHFVNNVELKYLPDNFDPDRVKKARRRDK